jgi:hypothetical protein
MATEPEATATRTVGLNPKVPAQAVVTVLVFVLAHFGIDLEPETALAIATLFGFVAGVAAPPAPTVTVGVHG